MPMQDYVDALAAIDEDEADFDGPKPEVLVAAAEKYLGVAFPPTYRRFLLEQGAGAYGGTEIYGVIDEDFAHSGVPDAIWFTASERAQAGLAEHFIIIGGVGNGDHYAIDLSRRGPDGEAPVVIIGPGGESLAEDSPDFGAFLAGVVAYWNDDSE